MEVSVTHFGLTFYIQPRDCHLFIVIILLLFRLVVIHFPRRLPSCHNIPPYPSLIGRVVVVVIIITAINTADCGKLNITDIER